MSKSKLSFIKQGFFDHSLTGRTNFSFKEDDFDLNLLKMEFSSLYQLFVSNKQVLFRNRELLTDLYYLSNLMVLYYQYDFVNEDFQKSIEKRNVIENFIKEQFSVSEQAHINEPSARLRAESIEYPPSIVSLAKIRSHIAMLNTNRSYWGYSRTLANFAIIYLQNGCPPNGTIGTSNLCLSSNVITILNESREPLIMLGIVLYSLRFLIHLILMIKHIIQAQKSNELSTSKVLKQELEKRGYDMASDLVWAIVNILTTFNSFFQISASTIPPIVASILAFDCLLIMTQWFFENERYNKSLEELQAQVPDAPSVELMIINRQIDLLNDEWEVRSSYFKVNVLAASIIVLSFGISMVCTGPLLLASLAFCSSLGNALYNTTEELKKYQQARVAINRELSNGMLLQDDEYHHELMKTLQEEYDQASSEFWKTLTYTVGGTAFIITIAVISWPVSLCLTLAYIAYRFNSTQENQAQTSSAQDVYRLIESDERTLGLAL